MPTRLAPRAAILAAAAALTLVAAATSPPARAEVDLRWRGYIQSDARLYLMEDPDLERVETKAYVRLAARLSKHVAAVGDLRVLFTARSEPNTFGGLSNRSLLDPVRLESDSLYVEFRDAGIDGLDIRLGRQQLIWGAADRFHAVSNLNPLDLEDPLSFGEVIANEMIHIAYRPDVSVGGDEDEEIEPWFDELAFELAIVPFFKPAEVPSSAGRAFTDPRVFRHRANTPLLRKLIAQQDALIAAGWTFTNVPVVEIPEPSLENVQLGARVSFRLAGIDLGLSYYRGFDDIPRATKVVSDVDVTDVTSTIRLTYPRMQVVGLDLATSLDFLDGMGLWAEVAAVLHDDLHRIVATGPVIGVNEVETEFEAGAFPRVVVGMDYTPVRWWYINVQYLYGFVDEFGLNDGWPGQLHHYIVAGMDLKMATDKVLLRFFNVFSLVDGSFSLFPQLVFTPWSGGEISVGALIYSSSFVGHRETHKFDSRATGDSFAFLRARASF